MVGFLAEERNIEEMTFDRIARHFGSVGTTMLTLYMAVTGGDDWGTAFDIVKFAGLLYECLFIGFTFFFVFAVFNILTGVFVEKAVAAAMPDRDEQILEERRKLHKESEQFRALCSRLDRDSSGHINW